MYFVRRGRRGNSCDVGGSFWENGFFWENGKRVEEFCCPSTSKGLNHLKENGILEELSDGSHKITSSPYTLPFVIPMHLKHVPISKWKIVDRIWLNV